MEGARVMATTIKPELSKKNPYWISRHRYYELKHFCLQYHEWNRMYLATDGVAAAALGLRGDPEWTDNVAKAAIAREAYLNKMRLVEDTSDLTDPVLGRYIFLAVTENRSYDNLNATIGVPCCRDNFYELYRRFFYILSQKKHTL